VLLFALSTSHKVGLALVAAVVVGFSLTVSLLVPRRWPQFPGRRGLPAFVIVSVLLFVAMISAVLVFGKESGATTSGKKIQVTEVEYKIELPKTTFAPGTYTFVVYNKGRIVHNLNVQGGGSTEATQDIQPNANGSVAVELKTGTYTLFCSIPGHRQQGMQQKITVS
jgi:plastocyanin